MDYRKLGNTELNVSRLCLGTMTMGWTSDKADSFAVMDYAVDNGINFFDTADVYSRWAEGNEGGVAESWIGEWLKSRRARDNDKGYAIIGTLTDIAQSHQATPAQVAIAWLLANPTVTSAIIGANTVAQLADTIKAGHISLSAGEKERLDRLPSPT
jgi:aryl-alcohol dehydrogenase-like predicted oxidoreductase